MNEKLYAKIADGLVDDGYIIVEDALDANIVNNLLNSIKDQDDFKQAGISNSDHLHIDNQRRRDRIRWLQAEDDAQSDFLKFTQGLQEYLNRSLYLGLSYYEAHFAIYDRGDFYEKHLDAFKNSKNRVVTTVYYLNNEWKESDGGELIIYDKDDNRLMEVTPDSNKLVVFMSEKFPHEVLRADKKRYSIAGWFRVDKI
ncbi:MAG: 2OG-Fe(II) oxygenase [Campylobacterota bacterium]|nr:2OG-Fe(II) oxygenase [Campylobacterota bacterium]